ncbi:MAG: AAA family ATPase [Sphingomonas sp.]
MLTGYGCERFRAFETAQLEVKPITILLGANGVGKTSVLQIPLLFQQTASAGRDYRAPLRIHGQSVNFGNAHNVFHGHSESGVLTLSFTDDELQTLIRGRLLSEFHSYLSELRDYARYMLVRSSDRDKDAWTTELLTKIQSLQLNRTGMRSLPSDDFEATINLFEEVNKRADLSEWTNIRSPIFYSSFRTIRQKNSNRKFSPSQLIPAYKFLNKIKELDAATFTLKFEISSCQSEGLTNLKTTGCDLYIGKRLFGSIVSGLDAKSFAMKSEILDSDELSKVSASIGACWDPDAPLFYLIKLAESGPDNYVRDIFLNRMRRALSAVEGSFKPDMVNHVGPLRAYPKRYYFLDIASTGAAQGDNLVELLRENEHLRHNINEWLSRFKIEIDVEQFREIIHRLKVKRDNMGFDLDITDVGFGLSQVLPVIAQSFLAKPGSITVFEQPEIHLHPNMQADLADLFIAALAARRQKNAKGGAGSPRYIIETHSEYLLNRLRRRIAEGQVSRDDVALYFVERSSTSSDALCSTLRKVEIGASGAFEWPLEFFEQTLEDTIQFLELQDQG